MSRRKTSRDAKPKENLVVAGNAGTDDGAGAGGSMADVSGSDTGNGPDHAAETAGAPTPSTDETDASGTQPETVRETAGEGQGPATGAQAGEAEGLTPLSVLDPDGNPPSPDAPADPEAPVTFKAPEAPEAPADPGEASQPPIVGFDRGSEILGHFVFEKKELSAQDHLGDVIAYHALAELAQYEAQRAVGADGEPDNFTAAFLAAQSVAYPAQIVRDAYERDMLAFRELAGFYRQWPDAPDDAGPIHLERKRIARPLEFRPGLLLAMIRVFRLALVQLDQLDRDEKRAAELAKVKPKAKAWRKPDGFDLQGKSMSGTTGMKPRD